MIRDDENFDVDALKAKTLDPTLDIKFGGTTMTFNINRPGTKDLVLSILDVLMEPKYIRVQKINDVKEPKDLSDFVELQMVEEPEVVEMWRVHGDFLGVAQIDKRFEDEFEARGYLADLESKIFYDKEHNIVIEKINVITKGTKI